MKREMIGKFLVLSLFSILVLGLFAGIVSAESSIPANSIVGGIISWAKSANINTDFLSKITEAQSAQFLLFILVALIIFAIAEFVPFLGGQRLFIKIPIAIIIAILAVFYLDATYIYTILKTYKAMGAAITIIIPFAIVAALAWKLNTGDQTGQKHPLISKFLWIIFLAFLVVEFAFEDTSNIGAVGQWIFWIAGAAALLMIIWERRVWFFFFKQNIKNMQSEAEAKSIETLIAKSLEYEKRISDLEEAGQDASASIGAYNRIVDRLKKLGFHGKKYMRQP